MKFVDDDDDDDTNVTGLGVPETNKNTATGV